MTAVKSGMQGAVQHVGSADALIKKSLSWVKQQCLGGKGVSGEKLDEHQMASFDPVSYTHLDVYKRQVLMPSRA